MDTIGMITPVCTAQIACDGNSLTPTRRTKGYCLPCEEAAVRRGKVLVQKDMNTR